MSVNLRPRAAFFQWASNKRNMFCSWSEVDRIEMQQCTLPSSRSSKLRSFSRIRNKGSAGKRVVSSRGESINLRGSVLFQSHRASLECIPFFLSFFHRDFSPRSPEVEKRIQRARNCRRQTLATIKAIKSTAYCWKTSIRGRGIA